MTKEEIQKARAIISAATPGRWIWTYSSINGKISYTLLNSSIQEKHDDWFPTKEDRILIAESRTSWEQALDALEEATWNWHNTRTLLSAAKEEREQLRTELAAVKALNEKYREALRSARSTLNLCELNSDKGCWKHDDCACITSMIKLRIDEIDEVLYADGKTSEQE